jgi:predicted site-specific integrase-resolvase
MAGKLLDGLLAEDAAAFELGVCRATLKRWRRLGEGPPFLKVGRRVIYKRSSLENWLVSCERAPAA